MKERLSPPTPERVEYPGLSQFNAMKWLSTMNDLRVTELRSTDFHKPQVTIDDSESIHSILALQLGYNPAYPLARITRISSKSGDTWFMTSRGWIRERTDFPTPAVREQYIEYNAAQNLSERPIHTILTQEETAELELTGIVGKDVPVTTDEAEAFARSMVIDSFEERCHAQGIPADYESEDFAIHTAELFIDEADELDEEHFAYDCRKILSVFPRRRVGDAQAAVYVEPLLMLDVNYEQNTAAIALPEHASDVDSETGAPSRDFKILYYFYRDGVMHKLERLSHEKNAKMSGESQAAVFATILSGEPVENAGPVGRAETRFAGEYLSEAAKIMEQVSSLLSFVHTVRHKEKAAYRQVSLNNQRMEYSLIEARQADKTTWTYVRETNDTPTEKPAPGRFTGETRIDLFESRNPDKPENATALKIGYDPRHRSVSAFISLLEGTPQQLGNEAEQIKKHVRTSSNRSLSQREILPLDPFNTLGNLFHTVRDYEPLRRMVATLRRSS